PVLFIVGFGVIFWGIQGFPRPAWRARREHGGGESSDYRALRRELTPSEKARVGRLARGGQAISDEQDSKRVKAYIGWLAPFLYGRGVWRGATVVVVLLVLAFAIQDVVARDWNEFAIAVLALLSYGLLLQRRGRWRREVEATARANGWGV